MAEHRTDIVILGAGIAGLWTFNHLRTLGYDVLLLEKNAIGGGQSIASQGIIHSGLKYALTSRISDITRHISAMPERWRDALNGSGPVDLSAAKIAAPSQQLMIPNGLIGNAAKTLTKNLLQNTQEIPQENWPQQLSQSGFKGHLLDMDELVLDIPGVIRALAKPHLKNIRQIEDFEHIQFAQEPGEDSITLETGGHKITARRLIVTAAAGNLEVARKLGHQRDLKTQHRPLLMGFLRPAPFELFAHFVGSSDKPVMTISTHKGADGELVWYLGAGVAECQINTDPQKVYKAAQKAFQRFMPELDLSHVQWAALPIDRIESKAGQPGGIPGTASLQIADQIYYGWPTKLTFAPMLSDMIVENLEKEGVKPGGYKNDWSFLPEAPLATPPWDEVTWKNAD